MNWDGWLTATPEQQRAMRQRYLEEVKRDRDASNASNYAGLRFASSMTPAQIDEWRRTHPRKEAEREG